MQHYETFHSIILIMISSMQILQRRE